MPGDIERHVARLTRRRRPLEGPVVLISRRQVNAVGFAGCAVRGGIGTGRDNSGILGAAAYSAAAIELLYGATPGMRDGHSIRLAGNILGWKAADLDSPS